MMAKRYLFFPTLNHPGYPFMCLLFAPLNPPVWGTMMAITHGRLYAVPVRPITHCPTRVINPGDDGTALRNSQWNLTSTIVISALLLQKAT
jgi:hypothetical protein